MPRTEAAVPSAEDTCRMLADLLEAAARFVAADRGQAMCRKWIPRDIEGLPDDRLLAMTADAVLLSADLLLSQPAASGTTALDRLVRSNPGASAAEAVAITALRQARFRLLRLEQATPAPEPIVRDDLSGAKWRVVGTEFPALPAGTALFGRLVPLADGVCCLGGAITPLDPAALAVARGHPAADAPGAVAGARWAEAVYSHVVRHGTLDVPGLNRPREGFLDDDGEEAFGFGGSALFEAAMAWLALAGAAPDAELLRRTRQLADLPGIADALAAAVLARDAGKTEMAAAFERVLLVQLETVARRERGGSGALTLEAVRRAMEAEVATHGLPRGTVPLLATLRQQVEGVGTRREDPALERLVQRIQGLRAKTVAQGCTEQEALAAAEKVAELLDRHGLSLGELDFRAQPCEGIAIQTDRRRYGPIDGCVPDIAAFFDCRVWLEQAKGAPLRYVFFGLRGDVAAARYLHEMVERAFDTETAAFRAGDLYRRMTGERRSATNSFQVGLGRGISAKLAALRAARDATRRSASGRDLVPVKAAMVDEEVEKLGLDLQLRERGGSRSVLTDAYVAGAAAGERFEVTPAITQAA